MKICTQKLTFLIMFAFFMSLQQRFELGWRRGCVSQLFIQEARRAVLGRSKGLYRVSQSPCLISCCYRNEPIGQGIWDICYDDGRGVLKNFK